MQPDASADARVRIRGMGCPTRLPDCAYAHSRPVCTQKPSITATDCGEEGVGGASGSMADSEKELLSEVAARLDTAAAAVDALAESERSQPLNPAAIVAADASCRALVQVAGDLLLCGGGVKPSPGAMDPGIVVPDRNRAFQIARSTCCLPVFLPPPVGELNVTASITSSGAVVGQVAHPEGGVAHGRRRKDGEKAVGAVPAALHMALTTMAASVTTALAAFPGRRVEGFARAGEEVEHRAKLRRVEAA